MFGALPFGYGYPAQGSSQIKGVIYVDQAQETELAQDVIRPPKGSGMLAPPAWGWPGLTDTSKGNVTITATIGQVTESDLAQALSSNLKSYNIGQKFEVDTPQPVTSAKTLTFAQATETETSQTIFATKGRTAIIDQSFETEFAQDIFWNPKNRLLPIIVETELAQQIDPRKTHFTSVDQAFETEIAQSITPANIRYIDQAQETDTAQSIAILLVAPLKIKRTQMAQVIWKFELLRSSDKKRLFELKQARERTLALGLNKAGAFNFTVPLEDSRTEQIQETKTAVAIYRDGKEVWSGPVWTVQENTPNTVQVGCVGWLQTLEKRISKPEWGSANASGSSLIYAGVDAGFIPTDLIARSNQDAGASPCYVFPGNYEITQPRSRTYAPFINLLDEINALSQIESGFDMLVDPITRKLNIYAKLQTIRPQLFFDYGKNVDSVARNSDSSRICNRMIAYSAAGRAQVDDLISQNEYGVFEEAVSLADVTDISILQAYAAAEIAVRSRPLRISTFTPRPFSSQNPNDPRIYEDFNIGDIGYLNINKGRLKLSKQAVRIFSAAIGFNDDGTESITSIQTTST